MKVGVFDSGIGGLSILKSLNASMIFNDIIYYGDSARAPYGEQDKEHIIKYSLEGLNFLKQFNLDMLIIACNTITAYALEEMKRQANFPIIGVIDSGIYSLHSKIKDKNSSILLMATKATINSKKYQDSITSLGYKNLQSIATGRFVPLIENGIFDGEEIKSTLNFYFKDIATPDIIMLGCTHFPLIKSSISEYFKNKPILVHPGDTIVEHICSKFNLQHTNKLPNIEYFSSSNLQTLKEYAKMWLEQ